MKSRDLLLPFGWIYGTIAGLRQILYRRGLFKSYDLEAPTISVGNITAGGTGKTPIVAFIAEILAKKGEKVCILTRGYGRENPKERVLVSDGETIFADPLQSGDEPFALARKLLGKAVVIADADRAEAGFWARKEYSVSAFILDDGFQHVRVKRDLDVVLIDATDPFGRKKSFLRESVKSLKRADVVVISRADLVESRAVSKLKVQISKINPNCKIFVSKNEIDKLTNLKSFPTQLNENRAILETPVEISAQESILAAHHILPETRFAVFCALGNPDNFFEQLRRDKFNLVCTKKFPDHHFYSQSDILKLEKAAVAAGAEVLLTTLKDAVKLTHLNFNLPCYIVESGLIFDDEPAFIEFIQNLKLKSKN